MWANRPEIERLGLKFILRRLEPISGAFVTGNDFTMARV